MSAFRLSPKAHLLRCISIAVAVYVFGGTVAQAADTDAGDFLELDEIDIGTVFDLTSQESHPVKARHAMRYVALDWFERQIPYLRIDRNAGLMAAPNAMSPRWDFDFNVSVDGSDVRFRVSDGGFRLSPHRIDLRGEDDRPEVFVGVRLSW